MFGSTDLQVSSDIDSSDERDELPRIDYQAFKPYWALIKRAVMGSDRLMQLQKLLGCIPGLSIISVYVGESQATSSKLRYLFFKLSMVDNEEVDYESYLGQHCDHFAVLQQDYADRLDDWKLTGSPHVER